MNLWIVTQFTNNTKWDNLHQRMSNKVERVVDVSGGLFIMVHRSVSALTLPYYLWRLCTSNDVQAKQKLNNVLHP